MEHRWGERVPVNLPVRIMAHAFTARDGRLTDLSVSGGDSESAAEVRLLSRIQVVIKSPLSKHDAPSIAAYVTRKLKDSIGIEWCEFAPEAIGRLLRAAVTRPYVKLRRPVTANSRTVARLSGPLLKHRG